MKILITGGCGYVGTKLIPKLLKLNHKVINIDTQWFGNFLPKHKNLVNIKSNISEIEKFKLKNIDVLLHLSSIANDPMAELDKNLSWETSALNSVRLMEFCKKIKIKKIIFASSGSVYGIKKEKNVTEKSSLLPLSLYNKVKMVTEKVIESYKDFFDIYIIRPATVCGYSKRMRLDVSVNILTFSALNKKEITVFGGKQIRPNIHIEDMCNLYINLLTTNKIKPGTYNAGFENLSILEIAKKVQKFIPSKIKIIKDNNDPRSYRLNSDKLIKAGFKPKFKVEDAIKELGDLYNNKILYAQEHSYSLKHLKKLLKNQ